MGETRVLVGVEVIAASGQQWGVLSALLTEALDGGGITPDDVVDYAQAGDGARYAFPITLLTAVADLADRLDHLTARHNRWQRPPLRLKIAVDLGDDLPALDRLLSTSVIDRCVEANGSAHTGLIMSDRAFLAVFEGDSSLREADFVQVGRAWVRVPGVDVLAEAGTGAEAVRPVHVTNSISGYAENVIQAGIVTGGVHFGDRR